ncbi:hypothetical protein J0895_01790 [Phormidium pseudopriestleyi FRX01]|uniref:Acyltransferase n=1 Tax=Phormidium pseudopriestleyi FRX01 TaxID=1759528 RepID=A0ABS3FLK0_9CYAN|nr:hypothetical protein [Phormidium pseudopriestleyi]MBO0347859.1 hypothetical protein [Phormidium pseudopriestleyi FRX01]
MKFLKLVLAILLAILPSIFKIPLYRWLFQYDIGKNVRIGLTIFVQVEDCTIGDGVNIGHFNCFYRTQKIDLGNFTKIGAFNLFRGGEQINIGCYSTILRYNTFNSIINPELVNPTEPILQLGKAVFIAAGHWLDFTDKIMIGDNTIIGGRNSSLWTHNRQRTRSISIGCNCYLGSEIRVAPGVQVASFCIIALGSVLMGTFDTSEVLIAGNPANIVRSLQESDRFLISQKTRADIPDDLNSQCLETLNS